MNETRFYYRDADAPRPNQPWRVGACAVLSYRGKILLEKRSDSGRWGLIGGGLGADEDLKSCVLREIREETGLSVAETDLCFWNIYSDPSRIIQYPDGVVVRVITAVYLVELDKPHELICSAESTELRYFTRQELRTVDLAETHQPILEDFLRTAKVSIQVPATTANLGPGFDCLGVALELSNNWEAGWKELRPFRDFEGELAVLLETSAEVEIRGEGEEELRTRGTELFWRALAAILSKAQAQVLVPVDLKLRLQSKIPLGKGLGSSAACIVAALCLGAEMLKEAGQDAERQDLVRLAVALEGHSDNVLPAFYGGARLSILETDGIPLSFELGIPPELDFILAIPDLRISTSMARGILPQTVTLAEAAQNAARLGGLILALQAGNLSPLAELMKSPLHIPQRSRLIPGYAEVEQAAFAQGALAVTISGAGPTILALAAANSREIGEAMVEAFRQVGVAARFVVSKVSPRGAVVQRGGGSMGIIARW